MGGVVEWMRDDGGCDGGEMDPYSTIGVAMGM